MTPDQPQFRKAIFPGLYLQGDGALSAVPELMESLGGAGLVICAPSEFEILGKLVGRQLIFIAVGQRIRPRAVNVFENGRAGDACFFQGDLPGGRPARHLRFVDSGNGGGLEVSFHILPRCGRTPVFGRRFFCIPLIGIDSAQGKAAVVDDQGGNESMIEPADTGINVINPAVETADTFNAMHRISLAILKEIVARNHHAGVELFQCPYDLLLGQSFVPRSQAAEPERP
jgi:hypothetical protein